MDKWQELKEHCTKQRDKYIELDTAICKIGAHIWQDVLNKMRQLNKKE